ncbi:glycosyltransferase family 1 protein [Pseudanabaena sp. SR411]|uniref:glycosyltransferase family 4 protein n=1 Tax=Pseudanabaena sp. SR411 TaxID=1980935 RepID=UPI001C3E20AC|nr:glycosyltransferase family 1 protein [Pseudanabaena sp. SR411]
MIVNSKIGVVYDSQIFNRQRYGGISRYYCELAKGISNDHKFDIKILAGVHFNEYLPAIPSNLVVGVKLPRIPKATNMIEKANIAFSKYWIKKNPVKIVHETFFRIEGIGSKHHRKVLTVHDMIPEKFYPDSDINIIKEIAIRSADHIICISESTKNDLLNLIEIDASKISVIYHGYSSDYDPKSEIFQRRTVVDPYILYVGDRYGYKNFWGLIQAYVRSDHLKKNFKIVCFGGSPLSPDELNRANKMGVLENDLLHFAGSDALLRQFYQNASVFVYPSMYEGFGIPPLEAMAASCPVVCSNTSSIPEVVGNAAELFDPYDIDSIVTAIEKVVFSSDYASNLVKQGLWRIKNFSWQTCAEQTGLVYSSLV